MQNTAKKLRSKLNNEEYPIGTFLKLADPWVLDSVSRTGLDFVVLDNLKGAYEDTALQEGHRNILAELDLPTLVRLRDSNLASLPIAKDLSADGIIVPHAPDMEQVQAIAQAYKNTAEDSILLLECDNAPLYHQMESILQMEAIDGIYINPEKLRAALQPIKLCGLYDGIAYLKELCRKNNKYCFIYEIGSSGSIAVRFRRDHFDAVICASDIRMMSHFYVSILEGVDSILADD